MLRPDAIKFTVQKQVLSGAQLVAKVLNITADEAKDFLFVYAPSDGSIEVLGRCNGATINTLAPFGQCKDALQPRARHAMALPIIVAFMGLLRRRSIALDDCHDRYESRSGRSYRCRTDAWC